VLAPAEQLAQRLEEPRRADLVVAVRPAPDAADALRAAQRVGRQLGAAYPDRAAVVLLLSDGAEEPPPLPPEPPRDGARPPVLPWRHTGQTALEATLRAAAAFEAVACALVSPEGDELPGDTTRQLLAPVVEDGFDFVSPCYATQRFEAVLTTGIVYPLTRALFGARLRQPIGAELALSRGLAEHLLGEAWSADPAHAGNRLWLVSAALAQRFRVCQAHLGARPRRLAEPGADLAGSLAQVVGLLFHEMRLHAPAWQRVKGSSAVRTYGAPPPAPGDAGQPQVAPMIKAFQLGYQELGRLWAVALPPQALLALKRLARAPEEEFRVEDGLWARIVYDFAVAYHLGTMDRALLLRSMTPLYLAWVAGFVGEVRDLAPEAVEERVERLCRAFEAAKPHLISRWRWPDRFSP
jgi:glucosylglycerate synthase